VQRAQPCILATMRAIRAVRRLALRLWIKPLDAAFASTTEALRSCSRAALLSPLATASLSRRTSVRMFDFEDWLLRRRRRDCLCRFIAEAWFATCRPPRVSRGT